MNRSVVVLACLLATAWPLSTLLWASHPGSPVVLQSGQGSKEKAPDVLLCGTGISPHYENIVDQLLDALVERKVAVKNSQGHDFARSTCLEKAKEAGASSLLYVAVNVSERYARDTTLSVQCVSADGSKLWEEEQKGPLMSSSVASTVKGITEKMIKKLQARVGQPGLPISK